MMCQNRDSKPSYKPTKIAVCLSKTKSKANAYQAKTILTVKTKFVMFFKKQLIETSIQSINLALTCNVNQF